MDDQYIRWTFLIDLFIILELDLIYGFFFF